MSLMALISNGLQRLARLPLTPAERDRRERMAAAAALSLEYEHWLIFAGRTAGFWAGSREVLTPPGCAPTLTATTAAALAAQLEEQERLRGRRPR